LPVLGGEDLGQNGDGGEAEAPIAEGVADGWKINDELGGFPAGVGGSGGEAELVSEELEESVETELGPELLFVEVGESGRNSAMAWRSLA
jgi:hypothetical protein